MARRKQMGKTTNFSPMKKPRHSLQTKEKVKSKESSPTKEPRYPPVMEDNIVQTQKEGSIEPKKSFPIKQPRYPPVAEDNIVQTQKEGSAEQKRSQCKNENRQEVLTGSHELIKQVRDCFLNTDSFSKEKKDMYQSVNLQYVVLDQRLKSDGKKKVSEDDIRASSCIPNIIPIKNPQYTESMDKFTLNWYKHDKDKSILYDNRTDDMYSVPLKSMVSPDDRHFILSMSNEKSNLSNKDGKIHPYRYYICYCKSIAHEKNRFVRELFSRFMKRYFNESSMTILNRDLSRKKKNMNAIIIYDRGSNLIPQISKDTKIVSALVFSIPNKKEAVVFIDYLATHENFLRGGFASLLINISQRFASHMLLQNNSIKTLQSDKLTYLCCTQSMTKIYARYGFEKFDVMAISQQKNPCHFVFQHFDGKDWFDPLLSDENQSMDILCAANDVSRWTNYLTYHFDDVEDSLYSISEMVNSNKNSSSSGIHSLRTRKQNQQPHASINTVMQDDMHVDNSIVLEYRKYLDKVIDNIKYSELVDANIKRYQNEGNIGGFVSSVVDGKLGYIPFGLIFNQVYEACTQKSKVFGTNYTMLTKEMLSELNIRIISPAVAYPNNNDQKYGIWIELNCKKCKKSCYVKKKPGERFDLFLTKAIYSKWTMHVFALRHQSNDNWCTINKNWNLCPRRDRIYFHNLKNAIIHDSCKHPDSKTLKDFYLTESVHVRMLSSLMFSHHHDKLQSIFAVGMDIRTYLKSERDCKNHTFVEREKILIKDIGGTKSLVSKPKPKKIQTQDDIKERYSKEMEWKKEYYADLNIQLRFSKICYVAPEKTTFEKLYPDSKDYVTYYRSEKYKKQKKKDPEVHKELEHFIALTDVSQGYTRENVGNDHVISQDYFEQRNEFGMKTGLKRITDTTVNKCIKNPNKEFGLSQADKRCIKAHVHKIMAAGEIQKIRLMEEPYKTETTLYKGKRSESYIRFQGIDSKNIVHCLSDDWLQLNFSNNKQFFQQIMSLDKPTGEYINVPVGSRKNSNCKWPLSKKDKGPEITYMQRTNLSCLFCSVASAMSLMGKDFIAEKIMSVYGELSDKDNFNPQCTHIIEILRNVYKKTYERRIKVNLRKQNYKTVEELIGDQKHDIIMIVLSNLHCICFVRNYIIDPVYRHALPRSEKCIRICAELVREESLSDIIKKAYSIDC